VTGGEIQVPNVIETVSQPRGPFRRGAAPIHAIREIGNGPVCGGISRAVLGVHRGLISPDLSNLAALGLRHNA
jgi:hypothetical protein